MGEWQEQVNKQRSRVLWMQKQVAELEAEVASLPTVGFHRKEFLRRKRVLSFVRENLKEDQDYLEWLLEEQKEAEEFEAEMATWTPEMRESWKALEAEQDERAKRVREAEKRREKFKLIIGGKADE